MARIIDETKIERIKEAALQLIVSSGFGNSSISKIASLAGVAEGYLYRFYKSKTELIDDLLFSNLNDLADKLEVLLSDQHTVEEIFEKLIRSLFSIAINHPERIKFLYVLMSEYNFSIHEKQRERIYNLCKNVKIKGQTENTLLPDVDEEDIYLIAVAYPIQFINHRLKSFFYKSDLGEPEIQKVLNICKNLIQR